MDKNLIKVLNQDKAQELINLGFKYTTETMNGKKIHSFFMSEELQNYVNSYFFQLLIRGSDPTPYQ